MNFLKASLKACPVRLRESVKSAGWFAVGILATAVAQVWMATVATTYSASRLAEALWPAAVAAAPVAFFVGAPIWGCIAAASGIGGLLLSFLRYCRREL